MGAEVEDVILYDNNPVLHDRLPLFDAAFFASSSAVAAFVDQWPTDALAGKPVVAIGRPTAETLEKRGIACTVVPDRATVSSAILALAADLISDVLKEKP